METFVPWETEVTLDAGPSTLAKVRNRAAQRRYMSIFRHTTVWQNVIEKKRSAITLERDIALKLGCSCSSTVENGNLILQRALSTGLTIPYVESSDRARVLATALTVTVVLQENVAASHHLANYRRNDRMRRGSKVTLRFR